MNIFSLLKSIFSTKTDKKTIAIGHHSEQRDYRARMNRLYKREDRRKRHTRIWSILQFMVSYSELMQCTDFYSFKKTSIRFDQATGRMRKEHIQCPDIDTAIRFCRMEYHYGICRHKFSTTEINQIHKWKDISIDKHEVLKKVLCSYKHYWDDVLNSYVRLSAKKIGSNIS